MPPVASALGAGEIGGFRMFTRFERAQLSIEAELGDGTRVPIRSSEIGRHAGPDARRTLMPADRGFVGEVAVASLDAALGEIGRLACELRPEARAIELTLYRSNATGAATNTRRERVPCAR